MANGSADVSEKEADAMLSGLKALADEWEERLKDPALQKLVEQGQVRIDPLVIKLLSIRNSKR